MENKKESFLNTPPFRADVTGFIMVLYDFRCGVPHFAQACDYAITAVDCALAQNATVLKITGGLEDKC